MSFGGLHRIVRSANAALRGGYVLAYHSTLGPRFVEQIEALYPDRPIPLSELIDRMTLGKSTAGLFAITVDDGYEGIVLEYSGICIERGWPITFYLPTGYINLETPPFLVVRKLESALRGDHPSFTYDGVDFGSTAEKRSYFGALRRSRYTRRESDYQARVQGLVAKLDALGILEARSSLAVTKPVAWEDVGRLARQPEITFESHGVSHQAVVALSEQELRDELIQSKAEIAARTGREVRHFCYPYGGSESIGLSAPGIVAEYYDSAVTMTRGRLGDKSRWALPRIPLYEPDTAEVTRLKTLAF